MSSIGDRVRESMERLEPALAQRDLAERVGMTPDALSRAINGQRRFASIELARIAEELGADLHWLITGRSDPNRVSVAARHDFDHVTGRRSVPGRDGDEQILADIALAYRQAYPEPATRAEWPKSPDAVREALGPDFVRPFARVLERKLGIGIVRVAELSTAYALTIGGRAVIALPATGNWFRENWDISHELAHLFRGDHEDGVSSAEADRREAAANAFAAELLLPASVLKAVDWDAVTDGQLADLVWNLGVSTEALCRRLRAVFGHAPERVAYWADFATQRLLRYHLPRDAENDKITLRMDEACQRRFPVALQEAHLERVASGTIGTATLAWMLGIDASALEVDTPAIPEVSTDHLASALGL